MLLSSSEVKQEWSQVLYRPVMNLEDLKLLCKNITFIYNAYLHSMCGPWALSHISHTAQAKG